VTGPESAGMVESGTQVATPSQEVQRLEFPLQEAANAGLSTPAYSNPFAPAHPAMCTPPGLGAASGGFVGGSDIDVEETPRPISALDRRDVFEDQDPTPRRPPVRTADRDDSMSPFPGGI
jgi:serine/threonine-protein kinase RIM15